MTIEEALEIIDNTMFYTCFANEKQDEAFEMAVNALKLFQDHKRDMKVLENLKGDRIAHIVAKMFRDEISLLEGDDEDGK